MIFRRKQTPEDAFWDWFAKNSRRLLRLEGEELLQAISTRLSKYDKGLAVLVSYGPQRPRELIVSADGMSAQIDAVETLCDAAPSIQDWKVIRFRPRFSGGAHGIQWGDVTVDTDAIRFVAYREDPKIGVDMYAHWRKPEDGTGADGVAFITLDHTIGEYEVMCGIGSIGVHPLEHAPDHAKPWSEFVPLFDEQWAPNP